mgnify:CR=1 FL=1
MNTSNITNYKPKNFAELLGVSVKTLQRWDREGILEANRTPTDRRYYTYDQYLQHHFTTLQMISLSANQPFYGIHQPCRFYSCFDVFDETDVKYLFLNFLADEKTEVLYAFTAVCGKIFFLIRQQFHCAVADIDQVD